MILKDISYVILTCFDLNRSYDLTDEELVLDLAKKLRPLLRESDSFYEEFDKVDQLIFPPGYRRRRRFIRARLKDYRITNVPFAGEKSLDSMTVSAYLTIYSQGTAVVQQWEVPPGGEYSIEDVAALDTLSTDPSGERTVRLESSLFPNRIETMKIRELFYFYPYKILESLSPGIQFSWRDDLRYGPMKSVLGVRYPGVNDSSILMLPVTNPREFVKANGKLLGGLVEKLWQLEESERFGRTPEQFEWRIFSDIIFLVPFRGMRILLFPKDKDSLKVEGTTYSIDDAIMVCVRRCEFLDSQLQTYYYYNTVVTSALKRIKNTKKYKDLRKLATELLSLKGGFIDFTELSEFYFARNKSMLEGRRLFGLSQTKRAMGNRIRDLSELITDKFQSINTYLSLRLNRLALLFTVAAFIIIILQLVTNTTFVRYSSEFFEWLRPFFRRAP